MHYHNDEPVLVDELERSRLVEDMSDAIALCDPPQVFGVHGDWGIGKTSFLHQIHYCLSGECPQQSEEQIRTAKANEGTLKKRIHKDRVSVVWFEAWRYQNEPVPVVALLQEMRSQLAWHIKGLNTAKKTATVAIRGALFSMEELTKKIGFQASKIQAVGEKWEEDHLAAQLPTHTLREQLESVINSLLYPLSRRRSNVSSQ